MNELSTISFEEVDDSCLLKITYVQLIDIYAPKFRHFLLRLFDSIEYIVERELNDFKKLDFKYRSMVRQCQIYAKRHSELKQSEEAASLTKMSSSLSYPSISKSIDNFDTGYIVQKMYNFYFKIKNDEQHGGITKYVTHFSLFVNNKTFILLEDRSLLLLSKNFARSIDKLNYGRVKPQHSIKLFDRMTKQLTKMTLYDHMTNEKTDL
ncbi:unnamed protein product [Didymodactylos carnosus]|uniref:Uncharacterized protein n=1 Tax=Didymodactylos carnosus TaxID=1234261 RepID=A0A814CPC3_9BILA|nr:unnamed protein product [Didymodactylos carnosus]CAF3722281.1 unnamed protein product [Didymodactylos carnosus]